MSDNVPAKILWFLKVAVVLFSELVDLLDPTKPDKESLPKVQVGDTDCSDSS